MDEITKAPQPQNNLNSTPSQIPDHKSRHIVLIIALFILGVLVGSVGTWAYQRSQLDSIVAERVAAELAKLQATVTAENTAEEFFVSGRILEINEEDSILVLDLGYDTVTQTDTEPYLPEDDPAATTNPLPEGAETFVSTSSEYTVTRQISFRFDENTIFKKRDAETASLSTVPNPFAFSSPSEGLVLQERPEQPPSADSLQQLAAERDFGINGVTVKSDQAITNYLNTYYAQEIISF